MLHATHSHKAKVRSFVSDGIRTPFEDIVTSTVFGPLDFMSTKDRKCVIDKLGSSCGFFLPSSYTPRFLFWKKRNSSTFRLRSVEPDLTIEIKHRTKIVVEVKWGAPLSEGELAAQWDSLSSEEQQQSYHLFIVRDKKQYQFDIESAGKLLRKRSKLKWKFHQLSWRELLELLRELSKQPLCSQNVRNWAALASSFLSREEFQVLTDWSDIKLHSVKKLRWGGSVWPRLFSIKKTANLAFKI